MKFIRTVDTDQDIPSGSVIVFNSQPDTKWVIEYGLYTSAGQPYTGWHATSLPGGAVLPIDIETFSNVTLISTNDSHRYPPCPPPPYPPGPCPPGPCPPGPHPPGPSPYWTEAPNMITVEDIYERDSLPHKLLCHGKIVRVNNYNGDVEFFEWDDYRNVWKPANFGPRFYTAADVDDKFETKEESQEHIQDALQWARIEIPEGGRL